MIRHELRALLRLAFPIVLTQFAQMGMGVADTVMAGQVSAADLAGVALGGNLFWPLLMLLSGVVMALTPSVAQLRGAGRQNEAGEVVRQALWIALVGGIPLLLLLYNARPLYEAIGVDPQAIPIAAAYLHALSWGLLPVLGFFALRYLCEALAWTLPAMLIAICALMLKIPLNLLFIYGYAGFGLEPMGGAGCGVASAVLMWLELLVMIAVVTFSRVGVVGVFRHFSWPRADWILRLIKLGLPIGLTSFLEFSMFAVVSLLIGRLGVAAVAAHQIGANVGGLLFMMPLALGIGASVRVGYNVGAGDLAAARISGWVAVALALVFASVCAVAVFFARAWIAGLYSNDLAVILVAVDLLSFVVIFQFFDVTQVTAIGALRGFKDTRTPMWMAIFSYWLVGLPVGVALGFGIVEVGSFSGVRGFWVGLSAGLMVAALLLVSRFFWLSRRDDRIVEFARR